MSEPQYRAVFDARVTFSNGGGLTAQGFRVDVPGPDAGEEQVAALFLASLGLLLSDRVEISGLRVVQEQHRGTRGGPSAGGAGADDVRSGARRRFVDLDHVISHGMTTYPGLPAPEITPHLTREASRTTYAPGTEFAIDRITMVGNTGTYLDSPFHRYAGGTDLAGLPLWTLVGLRAEVFHLADVHWRTDAATRGIPASVFHDRDLAGSAVLLHTGWDVHFGRPA